ncbi:TNT domain-containing protein [Mycolicibacterium tusciae]|uniref:TNT domain-containing protein n=1 Tax=Mycolicibacterium tusciae TaxID=75922 RepID=UPI00024A3254|nr:TNT domain-containing protein [Mycolicibacterium tusciae]
MALNLRELREWPPEIADLAGSTREAAANHANSADFYRSLAATSRWEGDGGDAARAAMLAIAGEHDGMAETLGKAATGMEHAQQQAEHVAQKITDILNYAAEAPAVQIDESTNQVIAPDTTYLDDEAAAKVAAKVADLQAQIAAALSRGEEVDADLAGAIVTATGTSASEVKTASSVEDLLLPGSGQRQGTPSADSASPPDRLDSALDQLAGRPGSASSGIQEVDGSAAPVPLNPAKIEQFKALARQTMLRDGVPPDQIEARLDAMVTAARQPHKPYTPTEPDKMPPPGFAEGFADRWFETEQGIKNLIGQGGPGAPGVWESWRDLLESTNDQITNPVGTAVDEVKNALESPSGAYYLGGKAAEGAIAAPGVIFGGEGALVARAGALDDLAGAGAIPREVIDNPTHTGAFEHHTPTPLSDLPSHRLPTADAPPPPLAPDSPLFDGYDPTPPGPEFTNPDGSLIYPDDSLPEKPYAIPGTVVDNVQLAAGTELERFGYPGGTYLAPEGTPFAELSLPSDSAARPYYRYVVDDPTALPPGWLIEQSQAAPWFHQPGGGPQFRIIAPDGDEASVGALVDWGFLREVK